MTIRREIDFNAPLTEEQKKMLKTMEEKKAVPDEDCPEVTEDMLKSHRSNITLHLSPQALRTAESFGKDYQLILSRFLESALSDSETVKRFLKDIV